MEPTGFKSPEEVLSAVAGQFCIFHQKILEIFQEKTSILVIQNDDSPLKRPSPPLQMWSPQTAGRQRSRSRWPIEIQVLQ